MASGTIPIYVRAWQAGESFTVASGKGSYTGFMATAKIARCVIPLTKPVATGVTATITGSFRVRTPTADNSVAVTDLATTVTDCGLAVDITDGNNIGTVNEVCSVGSSGITVSFS